MCFLIASVLQVATLVSGDLILLNVGHVLHSVNVLVVFLSYILPSLRVYENLSIFMEMIFLFSHPLASIVMFLVFLFVAFGVTFLRSHLWNKQLRLHPHQEYGGAIILLYIYGEYSITLDDNPKIERMKKNRPVTN